MRFAPASEIRGVTRYVIERSGRLYVVEDDIHFDVDDRPVRRMKLSADEIERRYPGLLDRAIADGLVPRKHSCKRTSSL
jgi:hypothetical protein